MRRIAELIHENTLETLVGVGKDASSDNPILYSTYQDNFSKIAMRDDIIM